MFSMWYSLILQFWSSLIFLYCWDECDVLVLSRLCSQDGWLIPKCTSAPGGMDSALDQELLVYNLSLVASDTQKPTYPSQIFLFRWILSCSRVAQMPQHTRREGRGCTELLPRQRGEKTFFYPKEHFPALILYCALCAVSQHRDSPCTEQLWVQGTGWLVIIISYLILTL